MTSYCFIPIVYDGHDDIQVHTYYNIGMTEKSEN